MTVGGVGRIVQSRVGLAQRAGRNGRLGVTRQWRDDRRCGLPARRRARLEVSRVSGAARGRRSAARRPRRRRYRGVRRPLGEILDLSTTLLELNQKRTSDPLRGVPASPAELAAARSAVTSARARLARLHSPPRRADVAAARLDIRRAQAEHETLTGGAPAARTATIQIAGHDVRLAQSRLDRILQPSNPADVKLAESDFKRAESELALLRRPQLTPSPEALLAAQIAINNARGDLARAQRTTDPS